jgi:hypothetical protein
MEYCVCGHNYKVHRYWGPPNCWVKDKVGHLICPCESFKLDNLKLIEDLAKERKLI